MLQMFVLALSLYNTWNRGVFLLCKITNLLIYSIKEENPMAEILMKQSKFITTKHDRDLHGLGLTCVEEAIKHYDGICKFFIQDGKFHVTLSIPIGNMSN